MSPSEQNEFASGNSSERPSGLRSGRSSSQDRDQFPAQQPDTGELEETQDTFEFDERVFSTDTPASVPREQLNWETDRTSDQDRKQDTGELGDTLASIEFDPRVFSFSTPSDSASRPYSEWNLEDVSAQDMAWDVTQPFAQQDEHTAALDDSDQANHSEPVNFAELLGWKKPPKPSRRML